MALGDVPFRRRDGWTGVGRSVVMLRESIRGQRFRNHEIGENNAIQCLHAAGGVEHETNCNSAEVSNLGNGVTLMNKNIVGIILIVLALLAVYFYGWPKLQPYLNTGGAPEETTAPAAGQPLI